MITYDYFKPPSILSPYELTQVLDLKHSWITKYEPLRHSKPYGARHCFLNTAPMYLIHPELDVISNIFTRTGNSNNRNLMTDLLALQPNKKTTLQIQEFVKELITNKNLYQDITALIEGQPIFGESRREYTYGSTRVDVGIHMSAERVKEYMNIILGFEKHKPKSKTMQSLFTWAQNILDDKVYRELERKKENSLQTRIIAIAEPEFGNGLRYAKLKPGIKLEDFVDFFHPQVDHYVDTTLPLGHPERGKKQFIEYENGKAKTIDEYIILTSRQNIDLVNCALAELLTTSLFTVTTQLNHALAGANFYKYLKQQNKPVIFPEIVDKKNYILAKEIYPIRMLLNSVNSSEELKKILIKEGNYQTPLPINFEVDTKLIEIEGPNKLGKSELLRTLYLATHLTNSGFPIPAKKYETTLFEGAHFFKFNKKSGVGGSELEKNINFLRHELKNTYSEDLILIDELGNTTNNDTSAELIKRLMPPLLERNNTIIITSHQTKCRDAVRELEGKVYKPISKGENPYQPISAEGKTEYLSNEVLDKLDLTSDSIKNELPTKRPKNYKSTFYNEPSPEDGDDDLPF